MPEIDERIAEFLNEKLGSKPVTPPMMARLHAQLSAVAVALVALIECAAARLKDLLTYRPAAAASPARSALRQELADHLRDAYDHQLELRREPEEAWAHVTSHFGDYEAILGELEELHQPTPLWEWITRALAFGVGLCVLPVSGVTVKDVIQPVIAMALLLAAPLAACDPRAWGLPGWTRWVTRGLAFFFFVFPAYEMGMLFRDSFSVALILVVVALLGRSFASTHYATRMRAWMLAMTLGFCALGLQGTWLHLSEPSRMGRGIAVVFVFALYGVLLARPRLWAVLLLTAACHGVVAAVAVTFRLPVAFREGISLALVQLPVICTVFGLLAAWAFYGRRGHACWFQSAGLVAMILTYIAYLRNLTGDPSLVAIMLSASLPLLLWLAPVAGVVYRKFQRVE